MEVEFISYWEQERPMSLQETGHKFGAGRSVLGNKSKQVLLGRNVNTLVPTARA
jgi:hypothetical protein